MQQNSVISTGSVSLDAHAGSSFTAFSKSSNVICFIIQTSVVLSLSRARPLAQGLNAAIWPFISLARGTVSVIASIISLGPGYCNIAESKIASSCTCPFEETDPGNWVHSHAGGSTHPVPGPIDQTEVNPKVLAGLPSKTAPYFRCFAHQSAVFPSMYWRNRSFSGGMF